MLQIFPAPPQNVLLAWDPLAVLSSDDFDPDVLLHEPGRATLEHLLGVPPSLKLLVRRTGCRLVCPRVWDVEGEPYIVSLGRLILNSRRACYVCICRLSWKWGNLLAVPLPGAAFSNF